MLPGGGERRRHRLPVAQVDLVIGGAATGGRDRPHEVGGGPLAFDPGELPLDERGGGALAARLQAGEEIALQPVAVGREPLEIGVVGARRGGEVEEEEAAGRPSGRLHEVRDDRRDDRAGGAGDHRERLGAERERLRLALRPGARRERDAPAQAAQVAALRGHRVGERLGDQLGRDLVGGGVGGEVDRPHVGLRTLLPERLDEAGDTAAESARGGGLAVAVLAAETGGGEHEGAGGAERFVERPERGGKELHATAERLPPGGEIGALHGALRVEAGEPVEAAHRAGCGPAREASGELLGRGPVGHRQDLDAARGEPLGERLGDSVGVADHHHPVARLEPRPGGAAVGGGRQEDGLRHPPREALPELVVESERRRCRRGLRRRRLDGRRGSHRFAPGRDRRGEVGTALVDEADRVGEGREVAELEVRIAFDPVPLADSGEELGLLDRVDAEVGLHVEIEVEHLGRVAGLLRDERQDGGGDLVVATLRSRCRGRERLGGSGNGHGRGEVGTALMHEADRVGERREVAELEVRVALDPVPLADGGEELGLLDGVDAEVGLHVEVEGEHLGWVAGLLRHERQDGGGDLVVAALRSRGRDRWRLGRRGSGSGGGRGEVGAALAHEADRVGEGREVAQLEVRIALDPVPLADGGEELGLLDGVDAEVGLHVEVEGEHLGRVAGLLRDQREDGVGHGVTGRRGSGRRGGGCRHGRGRRRGDALGLLFARAAAPEPGGGRVGHAQRAVHDLELRPRLAGGPGEPVVEAGPVEETVGEAELVGRLVVAARGGHPAHQGHADLRTETGAEAERVADRVRPATGEVEHPEIGIDLLEVRYRGDDPGLERLDREDVLDADPHRVAGVPLRVGDDDGIGRRAENLAQRLDLGLGAAAAGRGVRLVGDEDELARHRVAVEPPAPLHVGDELFHHADDVADVEAAAVEGAVGGHRAEQLADRCHAALARRLGGFEHHRGGAHPDDEAVAAPVERQHRVLDAGVGGGGAAGEEARGKPGEERVARDVVGGDHHHPPAAPGADPVVGDGERLGRGRAGGVDLGVRAAGTDRLGELRVAHREHLEEVAAVEGEGVRLDLGAEGGDPFGEPRVGRAPGGERFELGEPGAALLVGAVALQQTDEPVVAREGGAEDDPGLVAQLVGEPPAVGEPAAGGRGLVAQHERQAGIAQRVETGAHREHRGAVERLDPLGRDPEVAGEVEVAGAGRELDHLLRALDRLEARPAGLALDEPGDAAVDHRLPQLHRHRADEEIAAQHLREVLVVEDPLGTGEAEGGAGDHHRRFGRRGGGMHRRPRAARELEAAGERLGDEAADLGEAVALRDAERRGSEGGERWRARRHGCRWRRGRGRRCRCGRGLRRGDRRRHGGDLHRPRRRARRAASGGPEAAERLVQRGDVAELRVVRRQRKDPLAVAEHVLHEPLERPLRSDLDEEAGAGGVEPLEPGDEADRLGDLAREQLDHLRDHLVAARRIEVAGGVRDQRQAGWPEVEPLEHERERFARRRDDPGVEGVADGEIAHLAPPLGEDRDRPLDRLARAADHRLGGGVDVRHHDVPAAGRDRLERLGEREAAGGHERAVLAEAVTHHVVGGEAPGGEEPGERHAHREHRRLGHLGLPEGLLGCGDPRRVVGGDEDDLGERSPEQRRDDPVGLGEDVGHERQLLAQLGEHVRVLGALPGVEEGDLGRSAAAAEDPLRAQHPPGVGPGALERLERLLAAGGELGRGTEIDGEPLAGGEVGSGGGAGLRSLAGGGPRLQRAQALRELRDVGAADEHAAPQRHRRGGDGGRPGDRRLAHHDALPRGAGQPPRKVLLEHDVEVRAAEAERRDPGAAGRIRRRLPGAELSVDEERRRREVERRVRPLAVEARREQPVVEGERRLQQPGRARARLQMADVRLHRADRQRLAGERVGREHLGERFDLGEIADPRRGAVPFDQPGGGERFAGVDPGALDREPLPDRVRGGDPLAAAVRRAGDAADHGVDPVAVPLGVGETLEQEERRPFAHHEAVGAVGVGAGAGGRERPDLAELHVRRGAHVRVDAAGEHRVVLPVDQAVDRRVDRRQRRGAGGVADVVRPLEVEEVRHPAGDDVRQLAGHRVLGDLGEAPAELAAEAGEEHGPLLGRQAVLGGARREGTLDLREEDPHGGEVVAVAGHRVAEDHRGPHRIERALGVAVVAERLARRRDRVALGVVHLGRDPRRERQLPAEGIPAELPHPAADLRVGLVRNPRVGVVVEVGIPALPRRLGDAVAAVEDVLPEGGDVGRVGEDRSQAHDGDGATGGDVGHDSVLPKRRRVRRPRGRRDGQRGDRGR
ncbi:MAG: hypothetical protein BWX64_01026 [Acidobacteria bacterium ADurb.Bin051]|nr:MAG: hypothetical protein BWX64_01026 [Acidobacteria bacterium ADurb.Bin051]